MKKFTPQQVQNNVEAMLDACDQDKDNCVCVERPDQRRYVVKRIVSAVQPQNVLPPDSTELSSKKTVGDWKAICDKLKSASPSEWQDALNDFYYDRLKTRYLDPIDSIKTSRFLRGDGKYRGEGFAIVAIQCSLIEFLESCYQGKNYKHQNPDLTNHEYKDSRLMFVSFLTSHEPFRAHFHNTLANDFYSSVRCGVLHEARTKGEWIIHAKSESLIVDSTGPAPILYRDNFQEAIIRFIDCYRHEVVGNTQLQDAFIRKFNHLCT